MLIVDEKLTPLSKALVKKNGSSPDQKFPVVYGTGRFEITVVTSSRH
jgi:hypothetical protein